MVRPRSERRLRADLDAMLLDGCAFSFMVGIGESYIAPFALALGRSDATAALITTVPMLAGALLQLASPAAVGRLGSHKRWVVLCAALQAACFVPLLWGALDGAMSSASLYLAVTLYWGLGMATGPAWNTWAGTIVPATMRPSYFARRSRWSQAAVLAGLGAGGLMLDWGERLAEPAQAYAGVFGVALLARVISARSLGRQSEPLPIPLGETRVAPGAIRRHLRGHGRLLVFLLLFHSSVWIAAPYFTPYMLGPLALDYPTFGLLTGTAFLARILVYPRLGRIAQRSGSKRLLWIGSVAIVPLPALWLVSDALPWLLALQLLGGAAWAAFELATLLSFFEDIPVRARTSILTVYNLAHAFAIVVGSALGAGVLACFGWGPGGYTALFVGSALARLATLSLLPRLSNVIASDDHTPPLRTLGVRPSTGGLQRPVLPALEVDTAGTDDGAR